MINPNRINPERIGELTRRSGSAEAIEKWQIADEQRRQSHGLVNKLRHELNSTSASMAKLDKNSLEFNELRRRMRALGEKIAEEEETLALNELVCRNLLSGLANIPHTSVPDGNGEKDNRVERRWGMLPVFDFPPADHHTIGTRLGIFDFERGAKIAGARFTVIQDGAAKLTRALINFMIDVHSADGFREIWPPAVVNEDSLFGTGQLPKFGQDLFRIEDTAYFMSPTAEVQITNLHRDEILESADLPLYYCAYAPCFRAEAGSAGKDTRGLIRQHQFDKVELVKFVEPSTSYDELESLVGQSEKILQKLELPYRVVTLCVGDLGFASAKTYDLEVWLPGQNAFREIASCSNFEDFQARRAKIRYRPADGGAKSKPQFVHTLNASGLAIGRTLVAILENYQQSDGSVRIPSVLRPYVGVDCL